MYRFPVEICTGILGKLTTPRKVSPGGCHLRLRGPVTHPASFPRVYPWFAGSVSDPGRIGGHCAGRRVRAGGGAEVPPGQRDQQAAGDAQGPRRVGGRPTGRPARACPAAMPPRRRRRPPMSPITRTPSSEPTWRVHRDHRGGNPGLRGRHAGDPGVGDGRVHQADPGAEARRARRARPPVGRARARGRAAARAPPRCSRPLATSGTRGPRRAVSCAATGADGRHHQGGGQQRQPGRER